MSGTATRVAGLGAGGHAKVLLDALRSRADVEVIALLDSRADLHGTMVGGVPVLGDDTLLPRLREQGVAAVFIAVGSVDSTEKRRQLFELARRHAYDVLTIVHPRAFVSATAVVGPGAAILAGAAVNACARLGVNVLVNTGAIVEHDAEVGDHVHIASGAVLGGGVAVGDGAHVGLGAVVRQGIRIGAGSVVGAGAVVVEDVPPRVVVTGVPARVLRSVSQ